MVDGKALVENDSFAEAAVIRWLRMVFLAVMMIDASSKLTQITIPLICCSSCTSDTIPSQVSLSLILAGRIAKTSPAEVLNSRC